MISQYSFTAISNPSTGSTTQEKSKARSQYSAPLIFTLQLQGNHYGVFLLPPVPRFALPPPVVPVLVLPVPLLALLALPP